MKTIFIFQLKKDPKIILPCGANSEEEKDFMIKSSPLLYKDFNAIRVII